MDRAIFTQRDKTRSNISVQKGRLVGRSSSAIPKFAERLEIYDYLSKLY